MLTRRASEGRRDVYTGCPLRLRFGLVWDMHNYG